MTNRQQTVFEAGWHWGANNGRGASSREAQASRPDLSWQEETVFCNGSEDGAAADTWRLNLGRSLVAA